MKIDTIAKTVEVTGESLGEVLRTLKKLGISKSDFNNWRIKNQEIEFLEVKTYGQHGPILVDHTWRPETAPYYTIDFSTITCSDAKDNSN